VEEKRKIDVEKRQQNLFFIVGIGVAISSTVALFILLWSYGHLHPSKWLEWHFKSPEPPSASWNFIDNLQSLIRGRLYGVGSILLMLLLTGIALYLDSVMMNLGKPAAVFLLAWPYFDTHYVEIGLYMFARYLSKRSSALTLRYASYFVHWLHSIEYYRLQASDK
jgi:hypothetical protein